MKVKYGENMYEFKGDLDCLYFSNLIEEGIEEVELFMYEDIFKLLLTNKLSFRKIKDYITLYQALTYFGSKKEQKLIDYLYDKIYNQERKELQKEITDFFEMYGENIQYTININESIPVEFFKRHKELIDWDDLTSNQSIPFDFFLKNIEEIDLYESFIWVRTVLSKYRYFYFITKIEIKI